MNARLDIGDVISTTFRFYGEQFTLLVPAALVVFVPIAILTGLAFTATGVVGALLAALLTTLGAVLFQGMVVEAAEDMLDGRRDETVGGLLRSATPFLLPLLVAGILVGLATALGLVLLIVGAFLVAALFWVTAPAIVVERAGPIQGIKRSVELTTSQYLRVLGVVAIVLVITSVIQFILRAIFGAIDDGVIGYSIGSLAAQVLVAPLSGLAAAVLYFRLREAKGEMVAPGGHTVEAGGPGSGPPATPAQRPAPEPPRGENPPPAG